MSEVEEIVTDDYFKNLIQKEVFVAREVGCMEDWELYEHCKRMMCQCGIDYETGIKIITEIIKL